MVILAITTTFTVLSTLTVFLRLFTRFRIVHTPGWDDLLCVAALAANYVFFAFLLIELHFGLGLEETELSPDEIKAQLRALWLTIPLYNMTLILTKLSVVLLYMRLFSVTRHLRILLIIILITIIISGIWVILSTFLMCIPVRAFWDHSVPARCLESSVVWCLNAAIQITTDLILVGFPIPMLAKLNLPLRQKFALILVFALGFFVCATSIVRLVIVIELIKNPDFTRGNGPAATWSSVETNVAIICSCLPPLRPLISRLWPSLLSPPAPDSFRREGKETPSTYPFTLDNPFSLNEASYTASITGNASMIGSGRDSWASHRHHNPDGIQVVSELRWDLNSVNSADVEGGSSSPKSDLRFRRDSTK